MDSECDGSTRQIQCMKYLSKGHYFVQQIYTSKSLQEKKKDLTVPSLHSSKSGKDYQRSVPAPAEEQVQGDMLF